VTGLATYLWKEWRDQRVQVIGYALPVPLLMAIALLSIPGEWARADAMPTFVAIGGFLIGALTIASDLVPGELRRGRLDFLARLPCDLRVPFVAKTIFCGAALVGFCLYAWFWSTTLSAMLAGGRWFAPFEWSLQTRVANAFQSREVRWDLLDPLIVLATWIFAVSCWLPRGTLALPGALLVLALIGGPTALVLMNHHGFAIHGEELTALRLWLPATALLAAALSFLRGARHGRRALRLAGWTTAGTLLAAAPVWAWTANRWHDYVALDLKSDSLALMPVALGDGGRFVFANVQPTIERYHGVVEAEAARPVVVDLVTGEARVVGSIETMFDLPGRQPSLATTPLALVLGEPRGDESRGFFPVQNQSSPTEWSDGFDGRRGTRLNGDEWKALLSRKLSIRDTILQSRNSIVMPGGDRCWMNGRVLHVESPDGSTATQEFKAAPTVDFGWEACGAGFRFGWLAGFVDVEARRFVPGKEVEEILSRSSDGSGTAVFGQVMAIRKDGWLLRVSHDRRGTSQDYVLWSPGETTFRTAPGIRRDEWVVAAMSDGRVLVSPRSTDPSIRETPAETAFVDLATGARSPVSLPAGMTPPGLVSFRGSLPSGAIVVYLQWPDPGRNWPPMRLARIGVDGEMQVAVDVPGDTHEIGCPDESTVILLNENRRILRARFDGSPCEVLFPREEAHR
jgi:hypothetical protein